MAVSIDKSEGTRFVRYSSEDSPEDVERFVAEHDLVVDWHRAFVSSAGILQGRRVELFRLPILSWFMAGDLSDGFAQSSVLRPIQQELEGDGFFRVLVADLDAGHDIQQVTFESSSPEKSPHYSFLIARLGVPTRREAAAGGLAVESLLARRRQRMETLENEALRVGFLLRCACDPLARGDSPAGRRAMAIVAARVGGPRCRRTMVQPGESEFADQGMAEPIVLVLHQALRRLVARLTLDLRYRYEDAAAIIDDALAGLVSTG